MLINLRKIFINPFFRIVVTGIILILIITILGFYAPQCTLPFLCIFQPVYIATYALIFAWLVYVLNILIPKYSWKIVRGIFVTLGALALIGPTLLLFGMPVKYLFNKINSTINPYIQIISPAENSKIETEKTYTLKWKTNNIPPDNKLLLQFMINGGMPISDVYIENNGSYDFKLDGTKIVDGYGQIHLLSQSEPQYNAQAYLPIQVSNPNTNTILQKKHLDDLQSISDYIYQTINERLAKKSLNTLCSNDEITQDRNYPISLVSGMIEITQGYAGSGNKNQKDIGLICKTDNTKFAISIIDNRGEKPGQRICIDSKRKSLTNGTVSEESIGCM